LSANRFPLRRPLALLIAVLLGGATPPPGTGIEISSPGGADVTLTPAQLGALPTVSVHLAFGTDHGEMKAAFSGPLLWSVLRAGRALDPAQKKQVVREAVVITGADHYSAVLALGEISPAFENKAVVLATNMDGKALAPGHFRIVVPGDARGGRAVRDVVSLAVVLPPG
jgi:hypothetical protein